MIKPHNAESKNTTLQDLVPDLTPMLDILFILLVFFMLTAGQVLQSISIQLSSTEENLSGVQDKHVLLEISQHSFALNGEKIEQYGVLEESVRQFINDKPNRAWLIASDKNIPVERVLKILTLLQSQGIQVANILMRQQET